MDLRALLWVLRFHPWQVSWTSVFSREAFGVFRNTFRGRSCTSVGLPFSSVDVSMNLRERRRGFRIHPLMLPRKSVRFRWAPVSAQDNLRALPWGFCFFASKLSWISMLSREASGFFRKSLSGRPCASVGLPFSAVEVSVQLREPRRGFCVHPWNFSWTSVRFRGASIFIRDSFYTETFRGIVTDENASLVAVRGHSRKTKAPRMCTDIHGNFKKKRTVGIRMCTDPHGNLRKLLQKKTAGIRTGTDPHGNLRKLLRINTGITRKATDNLYAFCICSYSARMESHGKHVKTSLYYSTQNIRGTPRNIRGNSANIHCLR